MICISIHIYTYLYISIHIYTYLYISIHIYTYLYISIHIYTYLYISIHIYTYLYISIHIYTYLYISIHIYTYLYISIHIYTYTYDVWQSITQFHIHSDSVFINQSWLRWSSSPFLSRCADLLRSQRGENYVCFCILFSSFFDASLCFSSDYMWSWSDRIETCFLMLLDHLESFGYIWIILDHLETTHDPKLRTSASRLGYCVEYSHGLWHHYQRHFYDQPDETSHVCCPKCQPELCVINEHLQPFQPHRIFPVTIPSGAKISMISRWNPLNSLVFRCFSCSRSLFFLFFSNFYPKNLPFQNGHLHVFPEITGPRWTWKPPCASAHLQVGSPDFSTRNLKGF